MGEERVHIEELEKSFASKRRFMKSKLTLFYCDPALEAIFVEHTYAYPRRPMRVLLFFAGILVPIGAVLNSNSNATLLPYFPIGILGVVSAIVFSIPPHKLLVPGRVVEVLYVIFVTLMANQMLTASGISLERPEIGIRPSAREEVNRDLRSSLSPGVASVFVIYHVAFGGRALPLLVILGGSTIVLLISLGIALGSHHDWRMFLARILVMLAAHWAGFTVMRGEEAARRKQFERNILLEEERDDALISQERVSDLVNSMLPLSVVERLKQGQQVEDGFPMATVLFTDIAGFTAWSSQQPASVVVGMVNEMFTRFDQLAEESGVEKIKTIGDAYWCVGGLAEDADGAACAVAVVKFGLQLPALVMSLGERDPRWEGLRIRVGVHTGPVVAGICGRTKPSYDVFGLTSGLANQLEATGQTDAVHISAVTKELVQAEFTCLPAPPLHLEGVGDVFTFWVPVNQDAVANIKKGKRQVSTILGEELSGNQQAAELAAMQLFGGRQESSLPGRESSIYSNSVRRSSASSSSRGTRGNRYRVAAMARWGGLAGLVTLEDDTSRAMPQHSQDMGGLEQAERKEKERSSEAKKGKGKGKNQVEPEYDPSDLSLVERRCCGTCWPAFRHKRREEEYRQWSLTTTRRIHSAGLMLFACLHGVYLVVLLLLNPSTLKHFTGAYTAAVFIPALGLAAIGSSGNGLLLEQYRARLVSIIVTTFLTFTVMCVTPSSKEVQRPEWRRADDLEKEMVQNLMAYAHMNLLCVLHVLHGLPLHLKVMVITLCNVVGIGLRWTMGGNLMFYLLVTIGDQVVLGFSNAVLDQLLRQRFADERLTEDEKINLEVDARMGQELVKQLFPKCVVPRIQDAEGSLAGILDEIPKATVLFFKVGGLDAAQRQRKPREVVRILNALFCAVDDLLAAHDVEKIKTVGNTFLVCAGPPLSDGTSADSAPGELGRFGLRVLDLVKAFASNHPEYPGLLLTVQIGIHVGPVVGAVIGSRNRAIYDVFGDTVNTASRMMTTAPYNHFRCTEGAARLLQGDRQFSLSAPIPVQVKGKGTLAAYNITRFTGGASR